MNPHPHEAAWLVWVGCRGTVQASISLEFLASRQKEAALTIKNRLLHTILKSVQSTIELSTQVSVIALHAIQSEDLREYNFLPPELSVQ